MRFEKNVWIPVLLTVLTFSACAKKEERLVTQIQTQNGVVRESANPSLSKSTSITGSITVKKSVILETEFFYGADLQYSSIYDKTYDLYNQSSAMGHVPAFFRKNGSELQLIADNRRLFPSDVNHPERLISRYQILSETDDSFVLSEANSAEFLVTTMDAKASSPRDHWTRSLQYVDAGNYLLQETSVVMSDGTTVEIMESVFPRKTLTPSAEYEAFKMDPNLDAGAAEGPAARYRFLPGETIFKGEEKLAYSQHFDIGNGKTIDWYATANISDAHLEVARVAVEAWNRYFQTFAGINRKVVRFIGRLPENVKLGDPRYNVINWDSRRVAGAAYESQANDPFTGLQSHSLIYMPVAWFQIGMDYWRNGQFSDSEVAAKTSSQVQSFRKDCIRDLRGVSESLNSGRMSRQDAERFSIQLMKQTLFHEVGHALGLAHNFKGSLSFDRQDPKSLFSTSIMDYNDYEIERAAFESETSEMGPLLEYDRQALSAIYNKMKDVKSSDAVLPACNDAEADTEASGAVDPLCIRYDIEKDPTLGVATATKRLTEAKLSGDVSLAEALENVKAGILTDLALQSTDSEEKQKDLESMLKNSLYGVMRFYTVSGKESLSKTVKNNLKSLYVFEDGVLPQDYSESAMRERAFGGVKFVFDLKELPTSVKTAINAVAEESGVRLNQTKYSQSGAQAQTTKIKDEIKILFDKFSGDEANGLVKLKLGVLALLARTPTLPLYFGKIGTTSYDFESAITSLLYETLTNPSRGPSERLASARALGSYQGRLAASDLIRQASEKIEVELKLAVTNDQREFALSALAILKP